MMSKQLVKELHSMNLRLETYNEQLKEHMARTSLLEQALEAQNKHYEFRQQAIESRMEKQESYYHSLPVRLLQYVSIISGLFALWKLVK